MPRIHVAHIVSYTSAVKGTTADSVFKNNTSKWLAEAGEAAVMEVELPKAEQIDRIVVGNAGKKSL